MALRNLFGKAVASASPFKKDFGLSEMFGYSGKPQVFQVGQNVPQQAAQQKIQQYTTPRVAGTTDTQAVPTQQYNQPIGPNPAGIKPSSGSSGGVTGVTSNELSAGGEPEVDTQIYQDEQDRLNAELESRNAIARQQAESIFAPLISTAEGQLSRLGGELGELQGGVSRGADAARGLVNEQLAAVLDTLGRQETGVREESQKGLRGLAEDQRNTTTSLARQLGARGAGDTSAGDYASAAIGRQGLKGRGQVLESQEKGIREIEGRRVESQHIANQELNRIEQNKQQQLTSLAADFQNLQRQIEGAMATASSDERRYLADQQNQLQSELSQRLSDLESESRQRKSALQDWYQMQEVELQNSLTRVMQGGRYDATDVLSNIGKAASMLDRGGDFLTQQGADYITQQLGVPAGLFTLPQAEEDPLDRLLNQSLQEEQPQSQGIIPDNIPLLGRL